MRAKQSTPAAVIAAVVLVAKSHFVLSRCGTEIENCCVNRALRRQSKKAGYRRLTRVYRVRTHERATGITD